MLGRSIEVRYEPVQWRVDDVAWKPSRFRGHVLVVDDSSAGRRMISRILGSVGLKVTTVDGGREACDLLLSSQKGRFDLVLMDVEMPDIDGCEATGLLRASGYQGRIIALSACAGAETRERCLECGCDDFAAKPISFEMLYGLVGRLLPAARSSNRKRAFA
ncbi:MAG TPA: response regulator [Tepidisphaeraceae bacterium]|jgi:CheY-like chemotaxis protein|nr:response regulator [Tepidisphaeraceae bacterium]